MNNYLRGELYRVLRKKSIYIYFPAIAVLYFLIVLVKIGGANEHTPLDDAETLFVFLPAIVGGYLFAALYTDDLNSRNLAALVGFGLSKTKIALSKLMLMALFGAVLFALVPTLMIGFYAAFGVTPPAEDIKFLYILALEAFLASVAFSALAAIIVYGLQKPTFGMVAYILLSLKIVSQLLLMLLSWNVIQSLIPGASNVLMVSILGSISSGLGSDAPVGALVGGIGYIIYVAVCVALSSLAFHKKEMEF